MSRTLTLTILAALVLCAGGSAQDQSALMPYGHRPLSADSLVAQVDGDTAADTTRGGAMIAPDQRQPAKLHVVRRNFNYRRQVALSLGMMAFLAFVFTTTQSWNPD